MTPILLPLRPARFAANGRSGVVSASSIAIRAPLLQRNFADVHGVTRWEDEHLTLGSLRLIDGLTIDSLMFDLSHLSAARLGTELSVSAFGGHIRANVTTERNEKARIWELAGTASGISLPRLATALGATETVRGSVRASKFTFRGDPRDVLHATASIWTELIDFGWRERKADHANFADERSSHRNLLGSLSKFGTTPPTPGSVAKLIEDCLVPHALHVRPERNDRHTVFVYVPWKADAVKVVSELKTFAELNGSTVPYSDALSRRQMLNFGAPYLSREWFIQQRPYAWSIATDCAIVTESVSTWLLARLGRKPAAYAGGDLKNKPRKYAVIAPENPWFQK